MEDKRIAAQKRAAEYNRKMIGQLYRHFKGDFYRVLFVAVHSETAELLVIYCKPEDTTSGDVPFPGGHQKISGRKAENALCTGTGGEIDGIL